jgi:hypothetical protein
VTNICRIAASRREADHVDHGRVGPDDLDKVVELGAPGTSGLVGADEADQAAVSCCGKKPFGTIT